MPHSTIRGAELFWKESGSGPPLLLIHGTGGHADLWDPVMDSLSRSWRAIAYDRRGYARSPGPLPPQRGFFREHAHDAAELLRELKAEPAMVLGWSAGGLVALHLALDHPASVRHLILYEPPLHAKRYMSLALARNFIGVLGLKLLGMQRLAAKRFLRFATSYSAGGSGFDRIETSVRESILANSAAIIEELKAGTGEEITAQRLKEIACPISLLVGDRSAPFLQKATQRLSRIVPSAAVHRVGGAAHMMQYEHPAGFVEAVRQIERLSGALV